MSDILKKIKYDIIFVGAGIINLLEASYQKKIGKKILILEKHDDVGGAWRTLNIFGFKDVENAIHYFLPDERAPKFMTECLKWNIEESNYKFKCFLIPYLGYIHLKYNSFLSNFFSVFFVLRKTEKFFFLKVIQLFLKSVFKIKTKKSYYIRGGAVEINQYAKKLVKKNKLLIRFNTPIEKILFKKNKNTVEVKSKMNSFFSKKIIVSHGSRLGEIFSDDIVYPIKEKFYPRPALHFLIKDDKYKKIKECIFDKHEIVKYVHDISHYIEQNQNLNGKKVLVFALHPEIISKPKVIQSIFTLLKETKMISKTAKLLDYHWSDVFLPTLHDKDLSGLKIEFGHLIDVLKTENFTRGIGYNCEKWIIEKSIYEV